MVVGIDPYLLQVVVLSGNAQAFLSVGDARLGYRTIAQKEILELVHARIGEHERRVVLHHHGRAGHDGVTALGEVIEEGLADLAGGEHGGDWDY